MLDFEICLLCCSCLLLILELNCIFKFGEFVMFYVGLLMFVCFVVFFYYYYYLIIKSELID